MDTSHVTVGTAMYMITDCLTYPPKKTPAGAGRRCHYCPPASHAAQHERADRARIPHAAGSSRRTALGEPASGYAILHGLARRTAPQTQPPRSESRASRWAV